MEAKPFSAREMESFKRKFETLFLSEGLEKILEVFMAYFDCRKVIKVKFFDGIKDGLLTVVFQLAILSLAILEFVFFIGKGNGLPPIIPVINNHGEFTNPNIVRLIYLFLSFAFSFLFLKFADINSEKKETLSFICGFIGGVFLWQCLGECLWHFGIKINGNYVYFQRLECSEGLNLSVIAIILMVYASKRKLFSFGMWVYVLSFVCNWFSHLILISTYPFVSTFMDSATWFKISGLAFGIILTLISIYLVFVAAMDKKGRLIGSLFMYTGIGMIATGVQGY